MKAKITAFIRDLREGPFLRWVLGICAFFGFVWIDSVSHEAYWTGWAAIEYAVVAGLICTASGFGRSIYDDGSANGVFSAIRWLVCGLFLLAIGFYFVSICMKPGFPLHLFSLRHGRGAFIAILCSAVYGFFAQRRDTFSERSYHELNHDA